MKVFSKSIALIGWNPFQFYHFLPILAKLPNARFIIDHKKEEIPFDKALIDRYKQQIIIYKQQQMECIDGQFDLLVCQTPFTCMHKVINTPIVMMQYGYAKEPHNYGAWRSLADLNMVYGRYAEKKISHLSPVEITGNPAYQYFIEKRQHKKYINQIDPTKKTILYAPTWGDLSSFAKYGQELAKLSNTYNVIIKAHHNTEIVFPEIWEQICNMNHVIVLGARDVLLEAIQIADILISDYSGAIFDAIYYKKPVVLLNIDSIQSKKLDEESLEYKYRTILGRQIDNTEDLKLVIDEVICMQGYDNRLNDLRNELFLNTADAENRALIALNDVLEQRYHLTQQQTYIRMSIRELFKVQYEFSEYKKKNRNIFTRIKSKLAKKS